MNYLIKLVSCGPRLQAYKHILISQSKSQGLRDHIPGGGQGAVREEGHS